MQPTTYQQPELRDANDQIIRIGTFGKNTALSNSTNDGWIDYVMNNLEYLYNNCLPLSGGTMTGGITPSGSANLGSTTYRWGKVFAQEFDAPKRTISGKGSSLALPGYNRRARKTFTLANMTSAVSSGNYSAYDIEPGDYFTGASGYTYIFAGANPFKGTPTPYTINANHAGLIMDAGLSVWNNAEGNTTKGGYVSSTLHSYLVDTVLPKVITDIGGSSHLYAHTKRYTNAIDAARYNRFGVASGCSSSWAEYSDQYISALSEVQVYGSIVFSSSAFDTGEADQQLDVFKRFKHSEIFGGANVWLRDIVNREQAAYVYNSGCAGYNGTRGRQHAYGLVCFH